MKIGSDGMAKQSNRKVYYSLKVYGCVYRLVESEGAQKGKREKREGKKTTKGGYREAMGRRGGAIENK